MPRKHGPAKVSRAINGRSNGKYAVPGNGHCCQESPTGAHWWIIGSSSGAMSAGVCRYCGTEREFANTLDAALRVGVR